MLRFQVWLGVVVLLLALAGFGECQVVQPRLRQNPPGSQYFCQPQPPSPKPVSRTVQVDVPVPCPPPFPCRPVPACAPYPCCPLPCPPPCPSRPVQVRVDVVVRPDTSKPCLPQRYCCENPPIFEPIVCHAAWMLNSILMAPLGLGESVLGHGMPRQPLPPPTPVPCVPCRAASCMPPCPPMSQCAVPLPQAVQPTACLPQSTYPSHGNVPVPRY